MTDKTLTITASADADKVNLTGSILKGFSEDIKELGINELPVINLDDDHWKLIVPGSSVKADPLSIIKAAEATAALADQLSIKRESLASQLMAVAIHCADITDTRAKAVAMFEAYCVAIAEDAGWKTFPDKFRNYKSRIQRWFKRDNMPLPGQQVQMMEYDRKKKGYKPVKKPLERLRQYEKFCQDQADESPEAGTTESKGSKGKAAKVADKPSAPSELEQRLAKLAELYASGDSKERKSLLASIDRVVANVEKKRAAA